MRKIEISGGRHALLACTILMYHAHCCQKMKEMEECRSREVKSTSVSVNIDIVATQMLSITKESIVRNEASNLSSHTFAHLALPISYQSPETLSLIQHIAS